MHLYVISSNDGLGPFAIVLCLAKWLCVRVVKATHNIVQSWLFEVLVGLKREWFDVIKNPVLAVVSPRPVLVRPPCLDPRPVLANRHSEDFVVRTRHLVAFQR